MNDDVAMKVDQCDGEVMPPLSVVSAVRTCLRERVLPCLKPRGSVEAHAHAHARRRAQREVRRRSRKESPDACNWRSMASESRATADRRTGSAHPMTEFCVHLQVLV